METAYIEKSSEILNVPLEELFTKALLHLRGHQDNTQGVTWRPRPTPAGHC